MYQGMRVIVRLETKAREAKKGLWADPQPEPAREWQRVRYLYQ